ncbi:unnamed protein product [Leptidea sinapis]|uniref:Uncharacterized protein n=1 Tax=Leptidea sinapis TaxID=189913 RepID=A0A5E4QL11_9NEOP|nr:unnamed protein product [Leptidea sinapis]
MCVRVHRKYMRISHSDIEFYIYIFFIKYTYYFPTENLECVQNIFEELPSADNASGIRSGITTGPSSSVTSPMDADTLQHSHNTKLQRTDSQYSQDSQTRPAGKNSRVLVASRHLRNDSKTIQLEPRARQHSLDEPERTKPVRSDSKHSRDAFPRSTSRDFTGHSRNSSRDFKVHSRGDSRDLSLEQLKHLALKSMESLDLTVLPLTKCVDEESKRLIESGGVLRHRRTSSRDLKPPETKHKRTSSHHITMEPNELSLQIQKGRSVDHLASSPLDPQCVYNQWKSTSCNKASDLRPYLTSYNEQFSLRYLGTALFVSINKNSESTVNKPKCLLSVICNKIHRQYKDITNRCLYK